MKQPPTLGERMQQVSERLPHLTHAEREVFRIILAQDRYDNNLYGAFKRTKLNHSEEKQAA